MQSFHKQSQGTDIVQTEIKNKKKLIIYRVYTAPYFAGLDSPPLSAATAGFAPVVCAMLAGCSKRHLFPNVQYCNVWDANLGSVIPLTETAVPFCYNWFRSKWTLQCYRGDSRQENQVTLYLLRQLCDGRGPAELKRRVRGPLSHPLGAVRLTTRHIGGCRRWFLGCKISCWPLNLFLR